MKKRIIWKMFVLEIVTLGIYRLYWLVKTRNEMVKSNPSIKIKSPWFLLIPIIVVIASVVVLVASFIMTASNATNCTTNYNTTTQLSTTSYSGSTEPTTITTTTCPHSASANIAFLIANLGFYVGILVAFVMYIIWLWGYCQGIETITKDKMSFAISLVILILVPDGIDILIIQDAYNKVADGSHPTTAHTPAVTA